MAGAGCAAKAGGEEGFGDGDGAVRVVHERGLWGEDEIDAFVFTGGEVRIHGARVGGEVGRAVELDGVDEDGDDDGAVWAGGFAGEADELEVAFVECAHGGDEDVISGEGGDFLAEGCWGFDDLHAESFWVGKGVANPNAGGRA